MEFDPELWLRIKDKKITARQLRILSELAQTHSQTRAAARLGISVPVLHRHLKSLTEKLGTELVLTTPNGTWLTNDGRLVLKIHDRFKQMLMPEQSISLYCTPITHELLIEAITDLEVEGKKYRISINDDSQNYKALYQGQADMVIFDDPNYAIEFEGFKDDNILTIDIFRDTLIHQTTGLGYIRFKYGAQRLGFRFLEASQKEYIILYETSNFQHLVHSGNSFFINHSLLIRHNINLPSAEEPELFTHPIMAVSINPSEEIRNLTVLLREKAELMVNNLK